MANNALICLLKNLPPYIGREIFTFLIPESRNASFRKYANYGFYGCYSPKYDALFAGDKLIENKKGTYLCRISKKNGKHRYYLTDEYETRVCEGCGKPVSGCAERCRSYYCGGNFEYYHDFSSRFVGKDIDRALIELMIEDKKVSRFDNKINSSFPT